jgi:hypothetical protein
MKIKSVTYHSQDEANMAAVKTMARLAARGGAGKRTAKNQTETARRIRRN